MIDRVPKLQMTSNDFEINFNCDIINTPACSRIVQGGSEIPIKTAKEQKRFSIQPFTSPYFRSVLFAPLLVFRSSLPQQRRQTQPQGINHLRGAREMWITLKYLFAMQKSWSRRESSVCFLCTFIVCSEHLLKILNLMASDSHNIAVFITRRRICYLRRWERTLNFQRRYNFLRSVNWAWIAL